MRGHGGACWGSSLHLQQEFGCLRQSGVNADATGGDKHDGKRQTAEFSFNFMLDFKMIYTYN